LLTGAPEEFVTRTYSGRKKYSTGPPHTHWQIIWPFPLTTVTVDGVCADATPAQTSTASAAAAIWMDLFKKPPWR
jgi:hypothetical protein